MESELAVESSESASNELLDREANDSENTQDTINVKNDQDTEVTKLFLNTNKDEKSIKPTLYNQRVGQTNNDICRVSELDRQNIYF